MGSRGPVPKRSTQRRRVNSDEPDVVTVPDRQVQAPALRPGMHPLAVKWYQALADSAQSMYYEPSDWMTAQLVAEAIEEFAQNRRATMLSAVLAGSSLLLATEGDRRRLRLELERAAPAGDDPDAGVARLDEYRKRLSG